MLHQGAFFLSDLLFNAPSIQLMLNAFRNSQPFHPPMQHEICTYSTHVLLSNYLFFFL